VGAVITRVFYPWVFAINVTLSVVCCVAGLYQEASACAVAALALILTDVFEEIHAMTRCSK